MLNGDEWSDSSAGHFIPGKNPGTHFTGGWVRPRVGLDGFAEQKISGSWANANHDRPDRSTAAIPTALRRFRRSSVYGVNHVHMTWRGTFPITRAAPQSEDYCHVRCKRLQIIKSVWTFRVTCSRHPRPPRCRHQARIYHIMQRHIPWDRRHFFLA
jgi:hypothetical protein